MGATAKTLNETRRALDKAIGETIELQRKLQATSNELAWAMSTNKMLAARLDNVESELQSTLDVLGQANARALDAEERLDRVASIAAKKRSAP